MISSPNSSRLKTRSAGLCLTVFFILLQAATAHASQRIVSLNICFDQLLEDTVPDAAEHVLRTDQHAGNLERILRWQPDLVLANPFSNPFLLDALRRHSVTVTTLPEPDSWSQLVEFYQRYSEATGYGQHIDVTMEWAQPLFVPEAERKRVLLLQANHYSFAGDTLWDQLLTRLGAVNAAPGSGLVTLLPEQIVRLDPDYLVVVQGEGFALASRNLLHGALTPLLTERQLTLPAELFGCMAQQLPAVVEALRTQVEPL
ncbi:ABC transporter substrate-binding protein [Aliidiomarina soli]|uniref:Fe/B12 periplasmic-binding domain-containing protein n=1 Tax=Aliidiomarina soli TaxID=1928574 RepID=A0A432WH13_9GAMM|nr:ABC transporter substrate-binding protein [Aliidiomarina soli]RUO32979.1 hypothetical protein CWE14_06955 [Aliidiomarina soli]